MTRTKDFFGKSELRVRPTDIFKGDYNEVAAMALAERIFYKLPELAMRWGKSEDNLIHMAAAGGLPLSISYEGHISGLPVLSCQGFLSLYKHDAAKFLLGNKPEVEISRFYDPDCDPNSPRKHLYPIYPSREL